MSQYFLIKESYVGKRLDIFISEKLIIPRTKAQEIIKKKLVKVNNLIKSKSYKLRLNDKVEILPISDFNYEAEDKILIPQNIPIEILYQDKYLVVISKPTGMVVYPCPGHQDGTVMNALAYHVKKLANVGGPLRPGVVHRLDKETSGVMVIAFNDEAYYKLVESFKKREVKKEYLVLVYGEIKGSGIINMPIGRSLHNRKKMSVRAKKAKEAITEWEVIKNFKNYTLLKIRILTGRTHQIRVHFSSIGHPVLGDKTYGRKTYIEFEKKKIPVSRQMLHALSIEFVHPITNKLLKFESQIPEDMEKIIKLLSNI